MVKFIDEPMRVTKSLAENPVIETVRPQKWAVCTFNDKTPELWATARLFANASKLFFLLSKVLFEVEHFEKRTGMTQFSPWIREVRELLAEIH